MSRKPARRTQSDPLLLPSARKAQAGHAAEFAQDAGTRAGARKNAQPASSDHRTAEQPTQPSRTASANETAHANQAAPASEAAHTSAPDAAEPRLLPEALPLGTGVRLVSYHPCGLYVLDKPEGVLSHPNKKAEIRRSLLQAPYSMQDECYELPPVNQPPANPQQLEHSADSAQPPKEQSLKEHHGQKLYLLHRLDSATSGLLLLADNLALAQAVREAFANGGVRKTYLALCASDGRLRAGDKGRWSDRLQRQHSGAGAGTLHVHAGQGQSAVTDYVCKKVEPRSRSLALLELHPLSGRTHQLRVHCAGHALPIIGDTKYGDFRLNRAIAQGSGHKRLFLHAAALSLNLSFGQGRQPLRLTLESPLPPAFEELLRADTAFAKSAPTPRGGRQLRRS